jgi:UDP-glucose 4-epimerase
MSGERALVTGGAGFIGSHLVERLLAQGLSVTVLDDLSVGRREHVPAEARLIVGNILDPDAVRQAVNAVDLVFHLAAHVSIRASMDGFLHDASVNVMGTVSVLDACAKAGTVRRFICASSMGVYADAPSHVPIAENHPTLPTSPYGVGKLASERYAQLVGRHAGFESVCLRFFNTYGPRQSYTPYVGVATIFVRRLLAGQRPVIFGDGEQCRDFVNVDDVARANVLAMQRGDVDGQVFNVGTGRGTTVNRLATLLCDRIAPGLAPEHVPEHSGELRYSVADVTKARELLGYEPQGELERDLDAVIGWCSDTGGAG